MKKTTNPEENKTNNWSLIVRGLEKKLKTVKIFQLGDKQAFTKASIIPTGLASFDIASGIGGFPRGKAVELFGQSL